MRMLIAGTHLYSIRIPQDRFFDEDGNELEGMAIESRRLILISPAVLLERREEVLGHELLHCWEFHVPAPRDAEERSQLVATIAQRLRMDLEAQGGVEALKSIEPIPMSLPFKAPPTRKAANSITSMPASHAWECGSCAARMMCGSIENGPVVFHQGLGQHQMLRWFRCEVCDTLNTWTELATEDGQASGTLVQVPRPRLLTGRAASEWLAENAMVAAK